LFFSLGFKKQKKWIGYCIVCLNNALLFTYVFKQYTSIHSIALWLSDGVMTVPDEKKV